MKMLPTMNQNGTPWIRYCPTITNCHYCGHQILVPKYIIKKKTLHCKRLCPPYLHYNDLLFFSISVTLWLRVIETWREEYVKYQAFLSCTYHSTGRIRRFEIFAFTNIVILVFMGRNKVVGKWGGKFYEINFIHIELGLKYKPYP